MNNARRKEIEKLIEEASALEGKLDDLKTQIEAIRDEEQDYLDNMPESLQNSQKAEMAQAAIDALESAPEPLELDMDEVISYLNEAQA